ncbi:hypothetical protein BIW11_13122 [Tropilaelaps mercedesae]|uniref:Uncharacterized protein n=1 Tax=Tropilaelaps mercedesae TaxID=418985 RepID=A0A1V9X3W7_9ACAR|nr:hypothetical protein BIW11_13122 [Tropilaelaps mercedesae]
MENEATELTSTTAPPTKRFRGAGKGYLHGMPTTIAVPRPMQSPFVDENRGSIWLELLRLICYDFTSYAYYLTTIVVFYVGMTLCFHLGTQTYPPREEAAMQNVVAAVFSTLFNNRQSVATRFFNVCRLASNNSVLLWRYSMFKYFQKAAQDNSTKVRLRNLHSSMEMMFQNLYRTVYKFTIMNGSIFEPAIVREGLTKIRRVPANASSNNKVNLTNLAIETIRLIKTYALYPAYAEIRRVNITRLCIAFVPAVTSGAQSFKASTNRTLMSWFCPNVNISYMVSLETLEDIIEKSSNPAVPYNTTEYAVFVQMVEFALNGNLHASPQRELQRAYVLQQVVFNHGTIDDAKSLLPIHLRGLYVITGLTAWMNIGAPSRSSQAIKHSLSELDYNDVRTQGLPSKRVVDLSLCRPSPRGPSEEEAWPTLRLRKRGRSLSLAGVQNASAFQRYPAPTTAAVLVNPTVAAKEKTKTDSQNLPNPLGWRVKAGPRTSWYGRRGGGHCVREVQQHHCGRVLPNAKVPSAEGTQLDL